MTSGQYGVSGIGIEKISSLVAILYSLLEGISNSPDSTFNNAIDSTSSSQLIVNRPVVLLARALLKPEHDAFTLDSPLSLHFYQIAVSLHGENTIADAKQSSRRI